LAAVPQPRNKAQRAKCQVQEQTFLASYMSPHSLRTRRSAIAQFIGVRGVDQQLDLAQFGTLGILIR